MGPLQTYRAGAGTRMQHDVLADDLAGVLGAQQLAHAQVRAAAGRVLAPVRAVQRDGLACGRACAVSRQGLLQLQATHGLHWVGSWCQPETCLRPAACSLLLCKRRACLQAHMRLQPACNLRQVAPPRQYSRAHDRHGKQERQSRWPRTGFLRLQ